MLSAIPFNLDQSKILLSGNGLTFYQTTFTSFTGIFSFSHSVFSKPPSIGSLKVGKVLERVNDYLTIPIKIEPG